MSPGYDVSRSFRIRMERQGAPGPSLRSHYNATDTATFAASLRTPTDRGKLFSDKSCLFKCIDSTTLVGRTCFLHRRPSHAVVASLRTLLFIDVLDNISCPTTVSTVLFAATRCQCFVLEILQAIACSNFLRTTTAQLVIGITTITVAYHHVRRRLVFGTARSTLTFRLAGRRRRI